MVVMTERERSWWVAILMACGGVITLLVRSSSRPISTGVLWFLIGAVWAVDAELAHKGVAPGRRTRIRLGFAVVILAGALAIFLVGPRV